MNQKLSIFLLVFSIVNTIVYTIRKVAYLSIIWGIAFIVILISVIKNYKNSKKPTLTEDELNNLNSKIKELISQNKKSKAISLYRNTTGSGLKEAKEYIDSLIN